VRASGVSDELAAQRERLRAELQELHASWDYAFAMGSHRMMGDHPRFRETRRREADLLARLRELDPADD